MCLSSCVWYVHYLYFFFFKQKTAYEMRISDWSSDVCSSDLGEPRSSRAGRPVQACQRPPVAHRAKPGARNRELGRRGKVFPLRCLSLGDGAGAFSRVAPLPFEGRAAPFNPDGRRALMPTLFSRRRLLQWAGAGAALPAAPGGPEAWAQGSERKSTRLNSSP